VIARPAPVVGHTLRVTKGPLGYGSGERTGLACRVRRSNDSLARLFRGAMSRGTRERMFG